MNILVTGSSGFIGYNLCNFFLKRKNNVFGIDNFFSSSKQKTQKLIEEYPNFKFYEIDIREKKKMEPIFKDIDAVVNLAGQVSVQKSFTDLLENDSINSQGFINILDLCLKNKIKDLIFASSCSVYGETNEIPIRENFSLKPKSPYAASKISNETYSQVFCDLNYQTVITALRFFNVVGPWQSIDSDYGAVIPRWINSFLKNQVPLIFGDGEATRDFIDVEDISNLINLIISSEKNYSFEIFNVGSGKETKIINLFNIMKNVMKKYKIDFNFEYPQFKSKRAGDINRSVSENSKISNFFQYKDYIDIEKSISKILTIQYDKK